MTSNRSILLLAALLAAYAAATLNWLAGAPAYHGPGFLRLGNPRIFTIIVTAAQLLPSVALVLLIRRFSGWIRVAAAVIVTPFIAISVPLLVVSGIDSTDVLRNGYSNALVPLNAVEVGSAYSRHSLDSERSQLVSC